MNFEISKDLIIKILLVIILLLCTPYLFENLFQKNSKIPIVEQDEGPQLEIKQLIGKIREELEEMDNERRILNKAALLELDHIDLEINFVVQSISKEGGALKPQFLVVEKTSELSSKKVQKIKIHMKAVKGKSFEISGGKLPLSNKENETILGTVPPPK